MHDFDRGAQSILEYRPGAPNAFHAPDRMALIEDVEQPVRMHRLNAESIFIALRLDFKRTFFKLRTFPFDRAAHSSKVLPKRRVPPGRTWTISSRPAPSNKPAGPGRRAECAA